MDLEAAGIAASLAALCAVLGVLSLRGFLRFYRTRAPPQVMWGLGLGLGALATGIEFVAYVGIIAQLLLQVYVFASAGIVGILSLGSARVLGRPRWIRVYTGFIAASCAVVAVATFLTPLPSSMVVHGVISGNPPLLLLLLSSVVTVPATIVLLGAGALSLRRSFRWKSVLMLAGASVLGAGGALYIAEFPVMLYYAEFIGIVLLFIGLVDFSRWASAAPRPSAAGTRAAP